MPSINWSVERENAEGDMEEISLEVEYSCAAYDPGNSYGPPEFCDPPSGGEIEELEVYDAEGNKFTLTEEETKKLEEHIYDTHDYSEDGCDDSAWERDR